MSKLVYLLTGAAGFLGNHICSELLDRGDKVRALVLRGDKSAKYIPAAVEIVEGDLCDKDSLETFFSVPEGTETIAIHCASMVTTNPDFNQKLVDVNVGGTRNIIDKCLEHPECKKLVYVSSTGAIPELPKGTRIAETDRFAPVDEKTQVGCYSQTKAMATQEVLDACRERGLNACVVHPSGILGPRDYAIGETTGTIIKIMNGEMPMGMGGSFNLCDVRDLAHGCVAAADKGRKGECYILGNEEITLKEVCSILHKSSGCKMPFFYLPIPMAYMLAAQMEKKAKKTGEKPLMTNFAVYNLARNNGFDYSKAERELGYHPRPYADTLRDEAEWLVAEGYIKGAAPAKPVAKAKELTAEKGFASGGRDLVAAVAKAASKEELKEVLNRSGVAKFSDEALETSYRGLALSRDWNALQDMFRDTDFESCSEKLGSHGVTTTRENFDLICEVIRLGSDEALVQRTMSVKTMEEYISLLRENGYHTITADFMRAVRTNAAHLHDDALLTPEDMRMFDGATFMDRCRKSINTMFALGCIAELALGYGGVAEPVYLIAIAGGISLMYAKPAGAQ